MGEIVFISSKMPKGKEERIRAFNMCDARDENSYLEEKRGTSHADPPSKLSGRAHSHE